MSGESSRAVFLSYASQDAAAARRIADALRAVGIEAWFDAEELRGGDEWDRKIKNQIRTCALFVPIISASTQARPEGYFRLEWHLAEQRSLLIAKGRAFIVPVCIDDTRDAEALVPDAFISVQWSRPHTDATLTQFVAQVEKLLAQPQSASRRAAPSDAEAKAAKPDVPAIPDFELLRQIGSGSYGDVWLARGATGLWRAVKIVWRERFADAEPFEREWRGLKEFAAISLGESSQLALLHLGRNDAAGFFYYVMELADDAERGRAIDPQSYVPLTLAELRRRRGRLPAADCARHAAEIARTLAGLHRSGLVHRDIKPSNVILVNGVAKLADIGLVAPTSDARTFVGTEGFVPPEGPGAPAADVYGLGKVIYEIATGLDRQDFPQLPSDLRRLPDHRAVLALNEVILRACDASPGKRYPDASALLSDLDKLQAGRNVRLPSLRFFAAAAALVVLGGAAFFFARKSAKPPAATSTPVPLAAATVSEKRTTGDKSIVILPLENLSPDPADAFFADGLHAEIIATLTRLPDLRVTSRASAQAFKDTRLSFAEIGQKLHVANLVSGSVLRDGQRVRVHLELRRATDDAVLWQKTFERELQPGFAVQDEIAADLARLLQARASTGWYSGAKFMTKNPEAYVLFLKARELPFLKGPSAPTMREQIRLCEEALKLDPEFMSAASLLSTGYCYLWAAESDEAQRKVAATKAKQWAETCAALVPGGAGDGALAVYYGMVERNPALALKYAENEMRVLPNDPNGYNRVAVGVANYGRVAEAVQWLERALALDPLHVRALHNLTVYSGALRRQSEFEAAVANAMELAGKNIDRPLIAEYRVKLTGIVPPIPAVEKAPPLMLWYARRFEDVVKVCETARAQGKNPLSFYGSRDSRLYLGALRKLGRFDAVAHEARAAAAYAETLLPTDTDDRSTYDAARMWAAAFANDANVAFAEGRRYVNAAAGDAYTQDRWWREAQLALACAWLGRASDCVPLLAKLLKVPSDITVPYLRVSPDWDGVRDDAAFQALLADPENSGPLDWDAATRTYFVRR